jgi:hypothetical protein
MNAVALSSENACVNGCTTTASTPKSQQFLHAMRQWAQHRRASVGREYGGRVRLEGQRDGGRIVRPRPTHRRLYQRRVPAMHAVEHAQRHRAPVGERSPHTLNANHPAHP